MAIEHVTPPDDFQNVYIYFLIAGFKALAYILKKIKTNNDPNLPHFVMWLVISIYMRL